MRLIIMILHREIQQFLVTELFLAHQLIHFHFLLQGENQGLDLIYEAFARNVDNSVEKLQELYRFGFI